MKAWKKMIGTGMVLMAAFMLSACGNDGKNAGGSESGKTDFSGEKLTIGVWGGNEAEEVSLNEMIKTFEKDTGAKIEKKVYTDYNTQIQADMVGKTAPDVFYVDAQMYPFFSQNGMLAKLDKDQFESDKFYESLTETFSTDGDLYAVPKDMSTLALYLNTEVFEKTGVSVDDIPSSYEEYVKWLPDFQKKIDDAYGAGKVFAMSYTPELSRNYHLALRDGAEPIKNDGSANLSNKKVVENLTILKELVDTKAVVSPKDVGTGWNGEAFGTGKVAIMDEGNWVYQTLKTEFSDIPFTVREMPTYKDAEGSMMFSVGWGKYSGTKQSELADKWIQYTTSKEGMQTWVEGTGTLPSREDVAEAAKITDNPDLLVHLEAWDYATVWQNGVTLDTIGKAYENYLPQAIDGSESFEKAMKQADEQANADIDAQ
ncbi:sugar ABC transporter substrate-binding protein [Enterococcus termitis]|uniref:Sugar ABC transporter substrate-binding protein n=1 Tax=Enterococcus termitis TaxID=332950 RepID=A0A1E5GHV9_9ENTE|nr:extracellular solute-binding protein [Enterococcus termitis]OEG12292.1 sugar ABC transporter substrate-binding protein [Enterococcus termitis]OJG98893.1 ABC transporter, solute-binding protein [Enterococcus termitis]